MIRKLFFSLTLLLVVSGIVFMLVRRDTHSQTTGSGKLRVVASYYPLYDFAKQVGGDKVQLTNMTPAGAEPHEYEPSPSALVQAQKADVFIYNGGTLEPWTEGFLKGYTPRKTIVKASANIPLHRAEDGTAGQDPHFWLDPVYAERIVRTIANGLATADPTHKSYYARNADAYLEKLSQLATDYQNGLKDCDLRTVVSSHDAFSYLGRRYDFTIIPIAGLSTDAEPSASGLAAISQTVRTKHIRYIFFESLVSPRLADTIASETGSKTLVFDPIEGLTNEAQRHGKNYLSVQRENLRTLRTALACR